MIFRRIGSRLGVEPALATVGVLVALVALMRVLADPFWNVVTIGQPPGPSLDLELQVLLAFVVTIAVGELNRITLPGARESAPMSLAAAFALAMTSGVGSAQPIRFDAYVVIAATALAMLIGTGVSALLHRPTRPDDLAARFLCAAVLAVLFRQVPLADGRTLLALQTSWTQQRWLSAVSMLFASAIALVVQSLITATGTAIREHLSWRQSVIDELRRAAGLSTALAASGALIALAERPLGIVAIPVFLAPLVLTQFAVRRFASVRETYGQTIRTLSRLTEIGGYTPTDHPTRVADLSVDMAKVIGMSERDTLELEYAALLHDIGQVALRTPIPGGATVLAAPADQDRIARDGAEIVRQTGVLDEVATILEAQAKPYRHVRELGEPIPISSRIIKVANAYDDLVGDKPTPASHASAIERIHLGLGYEYDPAVVDALSLALTRREGREGRT